MWPDNETSRDFLNFEGVADAIAEMIVRADDRPVFGWLGSQQVDKLLSCLAVKGQIDIEVAERWVEVGVGAVTEVAEVALGHADVIVDHLLDLAVRKANSH
jgi:hypothetical protein